MTLRIVIIIICLGCAYLIFDIARVSWLGYAVTQADNEHVLGNVEGDMTIAVFLDYNCPPCKAMNPVLKDLVEHEPRVKLVPRPINAISEEGINPAFVVYAAAKQGKFEQMHDQLIANYRVIDDSVLKDMATEIGIDAEQLAKDIASKDVAASVKKNRKLLNRYGLKAVPSYVIGQKYVFTAEERSLSVEDFLTILNQAVDGAE